MIRCRFHCNEEDPRPVNWPIKHPYWVTGYGEGYAIVVAYADSEKEILKNWPDAKNLDSDLRGEYTFTDRFPKPEWLK
jgi:hypothetical protein